MVRHLLLVLPLSMLSAAAAAGADDAWKGEALPFFATYCHDCHGPDQAEAELDLTRFRTVADVAANFRQWEHVVTYLGGREMPPAESEQPTDDQRKRIVAVLRGILRDEGERTAGDPGDVLPRRLSNAEYDATIRDLTGVDIRPASSFPVDPSSGEGFTNTGEALTMSPSLFAKYYAAAEHVADHALLTPTGLRFAPHPVVTYADQKKLMEGRILRFYERHDVEYERYLEAAWRYRHRPNDQRGLSSADWAKRHELGPRYFASLWTLLEGDPDDAAFYLGWLRDQWRAVPGRERDAAGELPKAARDAIRSLAANVERLGELLCPEETRAIVSNAGNGPVQHVARRTKTAGERDTFNAQLLTPQRRLHVELKSLRDRDAVELRLTALDPGLPGGRARPASVVVANLQFSTNRPDRYRPDDEKRNTSLRDLLAKHAPDQLRRLPFGEGADVGLDELLVETGKPLVIDVPTKAFGKEKQIQFYADARIGEVPAGAVRFLLTEGEPNANSLLDLPFPLVDPDHAAAGRLRESCERLCRVFPNRFVYVDDTRGLSAGFHLVEGFFRDDQPLVQHVLDGDQRAELDRLWDELRFCTNIAERRLRGFVFFERSERNFMKHESFDEIKEEDPALVTDAVLDRFEEIYLKRSNVKERGEAIADHPIHLFFEETREGLRRRRDGLIAAKPVYLEQLEAFAARSFRRPLTDDETARLRTTFEEVASNPEYGVEQAVRATIVRTLVSPHFTYHVVPLPEGETVAPLPDLALASRLSYFLWSSLPDEELLDLARRGKLNDEETLRRQTRRMLADPRAETFAREFLGQWLRYRDFREEESVNRETFRDFDDALAEAMFEEPTRLFAHLLATDGRITALLDGDETFVNERLAKHYGLPFDQDGDEWQRVTGLRERGRGGLLGMGVFLVKNSQPERTSPVKRGFWVVHEVLGEHIPAPPADVAVLPAKETDTDGKTVRELLKLHTDQPACARCHVRFDPVGLAMEGFDPIGRRRTKDLAGRPVDDVVQLPDGTEARGVPEFAAHLATARREDFVETLSRKLLGYALGRSLQISDVPLLEEMQSELAANDDRVMALFETIVTSPQFRNTRSRDFSAAKYESEIRPTGTSAPRIQGDRR